MDAGVRFVVTLAEQRAAQLTAVLADLSGRGEAFRVWALSEAQSRIVRLESLKQGLAVKSELTARDVRRVDRVVEQLDALYEDVVAYRRDVGRSDLPAGLTYAVDTLVDGLIGPATDYVIHDDRRNMYSTVTLGLARGYLELAPDASEDAEIPSVDVAANLALQLDADEIGRAQAEHYPLILNLPGLDPANAILLPILAHEVGHIAARIRMRGELAALKDWPRERLTASLAAAGANRRPGTLNAWSRRFAEWTTEYICDAVATAVTGPCFVLAQAAMLRVSSILSEPYQHHPPTRDRVRFSYTMTVRDGWYEWYRQVAPKTQEWLESMVAESDEVEPVSESGSDEVVFLRAACRLIEPILQESVPKMVSRSASALSYGQSSGTLVDSIREGIPPAQPMGLAPPSIWMLILAAWEVEFEKDDSPEVLASTVNNRPLNEFLIKSNELSAIAAAWALTGNR